MKINFADKQTKINFGLILVVILLFALLCTCFFSMQKALNNLTEEIASATVSKVRPVATPMMASDALYRLYECGGKIGIYDATSGILIDVVDVFVSTLPTADQLALKKGIDIYAFADLASIIQDFTS